MSVAQPDIHAAFQYFLGRKPSPERPPAFASIGEMLRVIMQSAEFRASPRAKRSDLAWPLRQNFVSQKARVVYCPVGKNACTFLKRQVVLSSDVNYRKQIADYNVHALTDHVRSGMQLSDYSETDVTHFLTSPYYFRFAVIRAPIDRLLSAYLEKFVSERMSVPNWTHTKPVVWHVQRAAGFDEVDMDRGITFRAFVEFVVSRSPEQLDAHWRPQHLYLEGVKWDRLYKMSELTDVTDMLEARSGRVLPRKPVNVTGKLGRTFKEGAADLLPGEVSRMPQLTTESYLDPALRETIESYFAEDILLLSGK